MGNDFVESWLVYMKKHGLVVGWTVVSQQGFRVWGFGKEEEEESKTSLFHKAVKMDKSMLGDLDSLPDEAKLRMSAMIDQLQIRDRFSL